MSAKVLIKRTAVSGRVPNTSVLSTGELALNMTDGILYGTNGSVVFEVGANLTSLSVNSIAFPAEDGLQNQVLVTDGNGNLTFANQAGGATVTVSSYIYEIGSDTVTVEGVDRDNKTLIIPVGATENIYLNGLKLVENDDYAINNTSAISFESTLVAGDLLEIVTLTGSGNILNYEYSIASNTSTIEGADDNGLLFVYNPGQELVYLNGVKLIAGDDYARPNTSAIVLEADAVAGDILDIVVFPSGSSFDLQPPTPYLSSNTSDITIDTFSSSSLRTAKYIVQANTQTEYQATELLLIHDDSQAYITEYGTVFSGNSAFFSLSASVSGGTVSLIATPTESGTTFTSKKITLGV